MNTTPLSHYSAHIKDPHTLIIIGHFVRCEEGFFDEPAWAYMTVNLPQPITRIDEEFLSAQDDPGEFEPADLSHFYGIIDDKDRDAIWRVQGKDPKQEEAEIEAMLEREKQEEGLIIVERWKQLSNALPEDPSQILYCTGDSKDSFAGTYEESEFFDVDGNIVPEETITFWMPRPTAPTR